MIREGQFLSPRTSHPPEREVMTATMVLFAECHGWKDQRLRVPDPFPGPWVAWVWTIALAAVEEAIREADDQAAPMGSHDRSRERIK